MLSFRAVSLFLLPLLLNCAETAPAPLSKSWYSPSQINLLRSAREKGELWGLRGRGQESETNTEWHNYCICHIVNLSLLPEMETSFKRIMCATQLPLNLSGVGNGSLWAGNSTVIPSEKRCHVSMA
jgi:hypothetical protein